MASSRDIQEVVSKLSSDKAKAREEGVKLWGSWLEGERSIDFCKILGRNTASIKPDAIPHENVPLFSIDKAIYSHIWEVIKDVPSFQSEYSSILRHLLTVKDYRCPMRKRVYCGLVVLYTKKLGTVADVNASQISSKEDVFRSIVSLHVLLENPPGDYPDNIREDVVKALVRIFSKIRNEGKILRKLMECLNTCLLRDGPNLGLQGMEIHSAVQEILFRCWFTAHGQGLKSSFINFARTLLNLIRNRSEGIQIVEQLLDVIVKVLQ